MTANELADGILAISERIFLTQKEHQLFQNSATMLRQQQAEIESFKLRELTDEEILEVLKSVDADTQRLPQGFKLFARAILRKAQEK